MFFRIIASLWIIIHVFCTINHFQQYSESTCSSILQMFIQMYMYFRKHSNFATEFVILSVFWIDREVVSWLAIKTWLTFVSKFWAEYCWNSSDRCYFSTQWQFQESKYFLPTLSFLHSILLPLSFYIDYEILSTKIWVSGCHIQRLCAHLSCRPYGSDT